jgi:hypothetical protein
MKMRVAPLLAQFSEGIYPATVERLEVQQGTYGDYLQWTFSLKKQGKEVRVTGLTSTTFTPHPKCKFYAWSSAIIGRKFREDEELDTDQLHGGPCRVFLTVRELESGGSVNQVERVLSAEPERTYSNPVDEDSQIDDDVNPFD